MKGFQVINTQRPSRAKQPGGTLARMQLSAAREAAARRLREAGERGIPASIPTAALIARVEIFTGTPIGNRTPVEYLGAFGNTLPEGAAPARAHDALHARPYQPDARMRAALERAGERGAVVVNHLGNRDTFGAVAKGSP